MLLDGTDLNIVVQKNALGQEVYDQVFYTLDLEERDYFGLQFMDHYHVQHWLDPLKKLSKQVPIGPPYTFRFRVKFYSSEPSNLREELTRYQFFLQLKQDIQSGKLECPKDIAIELAALALQSELGDYNPVEHTPAFVSEFRFHPEQDEEMEIAILEKFITCRGQSPATAEMNYLNKAKWIELYGVDMHTVEGKDGNTYRLGLTPTGTLVFDGNQKIGLFFWEKIQKLDFKNRKLTIVVEEDADHASGQVQLHTFVFNLASHKACKHLWKCAIEHHTFFRLKFHHSRQRKTSQLFRLGSTFKYRGRTEYENVHKDGGRLSRRQSNTFERKPSQRYGPRQTLLNRRIQIRNEVKQQVAASAGLPVPDLGVPSEAPRLPVIEAEKAEEIQVPSFAEATVLGIRPSPLGSSAIPQKESSQSDKVAAAEARLDNLIFKNRDVVDNPLPPPTVKQLDESPTAARRQLNGTKSNGIANDIILSNGNGGQKPDINRIDVKLNALNDVDRWAVPPSGHVTTIAISNNGSHIHASPRSPPSSAIPVSRIPKYSPNNPSSSTATDQTSPTPAPSLIPRASAQAEVAKEGATPLTLQKQPPLSTSPAHTVSQTPPASLTSHIPIHISSMSHLQKKEGSTQFSKEVNAQISVDDSSFSKDISSMPADPKPSEPPIESLNSPPQVLSESTEGPLTEEKPNDSQKDGERAHRSRLPVWSGASSSSTDASKKSTMADEKPLQSRIPKMTSGHRPHQYFGQPPHLDRTGPGVTTYIPVVRTGLPSSQSRVITDL